MRKSTGNPQRKRVATRPGTRNERVKLAAENGKLIQKLLNKDK
jgi:hypothetical protein